MGLEGKVALVTGAGRGIGKTIARKMRRSRAEEADVLLETEPEIVLDELAKVTREAELACFATIMTSIETDLAGMKERANAWAIGDVEALQRFDYPDPEGNCLAMLFSAGGLVMLFLYWRFGAPGPRGSVTAVSSGSGPGSSSYCEAAVSTGKAATTGHGARR